MPSETTREEGRRMGRNLTFTFGAFASDSAVYPVREVIQDATDVPHKVRESRVLRVRVEQLRAVQKRVHELGVIRQRVRQDAVDDLEDDPHEVSVEFDLVVLRVGKRGVRRISRH